MRKNFITIILIWMLLPFFSIAQQDNNKPEGNIIIQNQKLKVEISTTGAELKSIQKTKSKAELLWQGNPEYWGQQSPILFPFVGRLWNGEYHYNGAKYSMPTHGFASSKKFELIKHTNDEAWFRLADNAESYKIYPFRFELVVGYILKKENLKILWNVKNTGNNELLFQLGGHTGFQLPAFNEKDSIDGYIKFVSNKEQLQYIVKENKNFFKEHPTPHYPRLNSDGLLPIAKELFKDDAIVFENCQAQKVILFDKKRIPFLAVDFDTPVFAIWTSKKRAPFICIEPWWGRGDRENFTDDLSKRQWTQKLASNESFVSSYTIQLLK